MVCSGTCAAGALRHEALIHGSDAELLDVAVPFLDGGAAAGEATLLALPRREEALVLRALADPDAVTLMNAVRLATPLAALRERHALTARLSAGGTRRVRMLGTSPREPWPAWARYEAAVNQVLGPLPLWALCPYDARTVAEHVIADVERTHPVRATADLRGAPVAAFEEPLGRLEQDARRLDPLQRATPDAELENPSPPTAGRVVGVLADATGLGFAERDAIRLAAAAIVANAADHGRPPVVVRVWAGPEGVVVTVSDAGPGPADLLAGVLPSASSPDDEGTLFQVREAVGEVALFRDAGGRFTVRLVQRSPG